MAVWFTRWRQGLLCEQFSLFCVDADRVRASLNDRGYCALRWRDRACASHDGGSII
jgi:hypothetical protein